MNICFLPNSYVVEQLKGDLGKIVAANVHQRGVLLERSWQTHKRVFVSLHHTSMVATMDFVIECKWFFNSFAPAMWMPNFSYPNQQSGTTHVVRKLIESHTMVTINL